MEGRCKVLEEKYERVKEFKKMMKNCQSMQCLSCSKWIQAHAFAPHVEQCCGPSAGSLREKPAAEHNREAVHISVGQTVMREGEERKKPFTEYVVQVALGESKWKVSKRYK